MSTTGAVVLAAGASRRLGEPKQLVVLAGETLLDRAVRTAVDAACAPVVVVLGAYSQQIKARTSLAGTRVVFNPEWAQGMGSSIRVGVAAFADMVDGVVILTCDQPLVTSGHLRALIVRNSEEVTASRYAGRGGVPAYFPASRFPDLLALSGDAGARSLLQDAAALEFAAGEWDVDTQQGLEAVRRRL